MDLSVVVPVRNGGATLPECLEALARCEGPAPEVLVVDDGSTDGTATIAAAHGARVLETPRLGSAAARNAGAAAAGADTLLFLDADCRPHSTALTIVRDALRTPGVDAVFGSYDDDPAAPGLASQFKNLHHHWIHQHGREDAGSFWTGCGAVRREAFHAVGGFDAERYPRPSLEDLEFGHRLRAAGYGIRLEKRLQVTHLKAWSLRDVVRSDVFDRAAPWTELVLERVGPAGQLNLRPSQLACGLLGLPFPPALPLLQPGFYRFLARRRGVRFAIAAWPLHWLYFASGAAGAALGVLRFTARRAKRILSYS